MYRDSFFILGSRQFCAALLLIAFTINQLAPTLFGFFTPSVQHKQRLTANADQVLICTCTCCGDRCKMGAKCCCSATKVPLQKVRGEIAFNTGCTPDNPGGGLAQPAFNTQYLPEYVNLPQSPLIRDFDFFVQNENFHSIDLKPESPPPRVSTGV